MPRPLCTDHGQQTTPIHHLCLAAVTLTSTITCLAELLVCCMHNDIVNQGSSQCQLGCCWGNLASGHACTSDGDTLDSILNIGTSILMHHCCSCHTRLCHDSPSNRIYFSLHFASPPLLRTPQRADDCGKRVRPYTPAVIGRTPLHNGRHRHCRGDIAPGVPRKHVHTYLNGWIYIGIVVLRACV